MSQPAPDPAQSAASSDTKGPPKKDRLAQALRDNLSRRKAAARNGDAEP